MPRYGTGVYVQVRDWCICPGVHSLVYARVYIAWYMPGYTPPGYTMVGTLHSCHARRYPVVRAVSGNRALGSSKEKPMGGGLPALSSPKGVTVSRLPRAELLRSLGEIVVKDRIAIGQHPGKSPMVRDSAQTVPTFLTFLRLKTFPRNTPEESDGAQSALETGLKQEK